MMAVIRVKWEGQRKLQDYKVPDSFWRALLDQVEKAEMCNRIPVDPNKLVLHNTDEMVEWINKYCPNDEFKDKFCHRKTILGTVMTDLVLVERIFVTNGYAAPIHSINEDTVTLYKKGDEWVSAWGLMFSYDTYEVKMTDRCKLRIPLIKEDKVAWAWINIIAETNQFLAQHLFTDEWELKKWEEYLLTDDDLYKEE